MAKLGAPVTKKFSIGTAEVRVGPMSSAGRLIQSHSIGLVDSASVTVTQESVDLEGGFPQQIVDTAVVKQSAGVTATMRETSRKNLRLMLGEGIEGTQPADVKATLDNTQADIVVDGTALILQTGEGALFTAGDLVVVYPTGRPEDVCIDRVASILTDTLTLENGVAVALPVQTESTTVYHVFLANQVAIGAITQTNYFGVAVIQQENSSGRPINFQFWKAAMSGSMTFDTNATDFASNDLELKILQPAVSEYGAGEPLVHLASIIPAHPTGLYAGGGD